MPDPYTPLLLQRLRAIHAGLDVAGFEHCVGGAIALAVHVREPRFTADIDLNVMADPSQPEALWAALPDDVVVHDAAASEIRRDGQTRLIWPDPVTPVDLFLPQHPTFHQLVNDRAVPVDFLGEGIRVMSATDLIVFKSMFDRSKDWVDIETMIECGSGDVDEAVRWLTQFFGSDDSRIARLRRLEHGPGLAGQPPVELPRPE